MAKVERWLPRSNGRHAQGLRTTVHVQWMRSTSRIKPIIGIEAYFWRRIAAHIVFGGASRIRKSMIDVSASRLFVPNHDRGDRNRGCRICFTFPPWRRMRAVGQWPPWMPILFAENATGIIATCARREMQTRLRLGVVLMRRCAAAMCGRTFYGKENYWELMTAEIVKHLNCWKLVGNLICRRW